MKVYKFFKIPNDNDDRDMYLEDKYVLYAITNNKEYAKRFKEDRNMDKFIYQVNKGVTKEEYAQMCNENRGSVLMIHSVDTVMDKPRVRKNIVEKKVLITYWEKQLIEEPMLPFENEEFWRHMPPPHIFKDKYVKALKKIEYITYYKLMNAPYMSHNMANKLSETDDDYSGPSIIYDELSVLIHTIEDTLL